MSFAPNAELVASAWLRLAVPGIGVATTLPKVDAAMRTSGFLRVQTVGGTPDTYVPMRAPVVAVEAWAAPATDSSSQPPWGRANTLAERVLAATYNPVLMNVAVDLSSAGDYLPARVRTVVAVSEPRRVTDDPSNFARFDLDLLFTWATA